MGYIVGHERQCSWCGQPFLTRRKSSQHCSTACMRATDYDQNRDNYLALSKFHRAARRGARLERFSHVEIFERDRWTCYLCGELTDRTVVWPHPLMPSLDHVIPISLGGPHSRANTKCAHLGCNLRKGDRLLAG